MSFLAVHVRHLAALRLDFRRLPPHHPVRSLVLLELSWEGPMSVSSFSRTAAGNRAYCWFASDVTAALLVVKNKSISLLWELNSIFMQIIRENILLY